MSVVFPGMMSWNIYFFYFKLSDNNAKIFWKQFLVEKKNNNNREAFLPDMYRQIIPVLIK